MHNFVFLLFLVSASASAGGFEGLLKNAVNAAVQELKQEERPKIQPESTATSTSDNEKPPSTVGNKESEIVIGVDCISRSGWQSTAQARQACNQKHYDQCLDLLASLPTTEEGEGKLLEIFRHDNGRCAITKMEGDRGRYGAAIKAKQSQMCVGLLEALSLDGISERNTSKYAANDQSTWWNRCNRSHEFRAKKEEKIQQIAEIEREKKKAEKELSLKNNAGLIDKYKKIAPAPAELLSADIVVQWGGNNFGPLIKFIDTVQNNSLSKAKYEMKGKSLVIRHRITDPVTGKSSSLIYVFTPFQELPPGEILLTRIVGEKSAIGGLIKEQDEVDVKQIGTVFALVYAGMTNKQ